jgi:hypothetical protein
MLKALMLARPFDTAKWDALMAPDCHLRIGNEPPAVGKTEAMRALSRLLGCVEGFGYGFCEVWKRRETLYVETDIAFTAPDGEPAAIPCTILAREIGGALKDLRFHLDPAPLPGWQGPRTRH